MKKKSNNLKTELSRRNFLKKSLLTTTAFLSYGSLSSLSAESDIVPPRKGLIHLFMEKDNPSLLIIKGKEKLKMLEKGLEKLSSTTKLFKDRRITLKPNAVFPTPYPVCTDAEFIIHLGKLLYDYGAKEVTVFDAPRTGTASERTFKQMKLTKKAPPLGIKLFPGDAAKKEQFIETINPDWEVMDKVGLSTHLRESEVIINLPVVKRHIEATFTCALKNHFGSVYGPNRWENHIKLHKGGTVDEWDENFRIPFRKLAAEFSNAVGCELNIVDASSILIKSGPMLDGAEIKENIGEIIISSDIVATDAYCSKLMARHDETYSTAMWEPVLKYGEKLGLGTSDLSKVDVKSIEI